MRGLRVFGGVVVPSIARRSRARARVKGCLHQATRRECDIGRVRMRDPAGNSDDADSRPRKGGCIMPDGASRAISAEEARRRLDQLHAREKHGHLTVHEAGEITKLLVILGEHQAGKKAA